MGSIYHLKQLKEVTEPNTCYFVQFTLRDINNVAIVPVHITYTPVTIITKVNITNAINLNLHYINMFKYQLPLVSKH